MYTAKEYEEKELHFIEVINDKASSWLKVVPKRGGIITSLGLKGAELLFLNEETLHNESKNIRGGIPILFPISGQLTDGKFEWNEQQYNMKNHGFARDLPWEVIDIKTEEHEASLKLKLSSTPDTMTSYPFEFELIFTYTLRESELILKQEYKNKSSIEMPIYAGFHPYFKAASKQFRLETNANEYYDYNDGQTKPLSEEVSLNQKEAYVLKDPTGSVRFTFDDNDQPITMKYDDQFPYLVLWSEEGQEFICVEPWMATTNELNRKKELKMIEPGTELHTTVSISR